MKATHLLAVLFTGTSCLFARNPISPPQICPADPSAKLGADGRLYVYCSQDISPDFYCSHSNVTLSTGDMKTWQWHPQSFVSKGDQGKPDMLPDNDALLYAPDCQYRDGNYYLYFCQPGGIATGVAVSKSPAGPFGNATFLNVGKYLEIDPSTFIDDDGQAYHVWGQFTLKMAKLNKDMRTLEVDSIRDNVLTEQEHHFHEGGYHRSTQGCVTMRKACVEPITFRADGSIPEVEMTTQGAEGPIEATQRIEAEQACTLMGNVRVSFGDDGGEILSDIRNGDRATYKYLDFKSPPKKLHLRVKPGKLDSTLSVHQDQVWHRKLADIPIKGDPNGPWTDVVCDVAQVTGIHAVVLAFQCQGGDGPLLDWWKFE